MTTWTRVIGGFMTTAVATQMAFAQAVPQRDPTGAAPPAAGEIAAGADGAAAKTGFEAELDRVLEAHEDGAALRDFYAARDFEPFWTGDGGARLAGLETAVSAAPGHGLPADRYDLAALEAEGVAGREVAATELYLRLAGDLTAGIVKPSSIDPEMNLAPVRRSDADLLARLESGDVAAALAGLEPGGDYRALMAEKARLEALLGTGAWGAEVPDGPSLHVGERDPRVVVLRERLVRLGYVPEIAEEAAETREAGAPEAERRELPVPEAFFDPALEAALKAFQRDYGLLDDGVPGRQTLRALNGTVEDRLRQVVVNLERRRWMNHDLGDRRIVVNIPDYSAELIEDGAVVWQTRTVVGEMKTQTPEFSDEMTYFVVNPTWHIPDSIATRVYLPQLRSDPTVLERNDMSLFTRSGQQINPRLVNFEQYTAENFPFRVKQNPNSANALGRVKFMFPNRFSIYLHDTPARQLFNRDGRAFSNGCIRLEKPLELAYVLLDGQAADPQAAFAGWLDGGKERQVNLERPLDVHLLYRTVWAEDGGEIRYRSDIYGRDVKTGRALEAAGVEIGKSASG